VKKILLILACCWPLVTQATETIRIQSPYTATHSGTSAVLRIIDTANSMQKDFNFMLEFRPGGNQVLAVKQMDLSPQNNLAIVAASFVENTQQGLLSASNYVPIWSLGDACWLVLSTSSAVSSVAGLSNVGELIVGTVGFGNATHLTALQIAKRYNLKVQLVPFKSNYDAVINMVGNHGVTFGMDTLSTFENLKNKNSRLKVLAVSCAKRLSEYPEIATLREQGIVAPSVINIVVANKNMDVNRRIRIGRVLEQATEKIGESEILKISGFSPAQFNEMSAQEHFKKSMDLVRQLKAHYLKELQATQ